MNEALELTLDALKSEELFPDENEDVRDFFRYWLLQYWENQKEPNLFMIELQDLWFYTKINFLSRLARLGYTAAQHMLSMELKQNSKKMESRVYRQTKVAW